MASARHLLHELLTRFRRQWAQCPLSAWLVLGAAALFLFACNITPYIEGSWRVHALAFKKVGVLTGLLAALVFLGCSAIQRGDWKRMGSPKTSACFALAAGWLWIWLGRWELLSHGTVFEQMVPDFWNIRFGPVCDALLKRAGVPALGVLLGVTPTSYVAFWFVLYFITLRLAVGWLVEQGLSCIEILSLASSTILAYLLILPGYSEVLVFLLGLYCLGRKTSVVEKMVVMAVALSAHEVAAAIVFFGLILGQDKNDREQWLFVWPLLLVAYAGAGSVAAQLASSEHVFECTMAEGKSILQWIIDQPARLLAGVFAAYKLYWVVVLAGLQKRKHWGFCVAALAAVPLIFFAVDTSRVVQFASVGLLLLAPLILQSWSRSARLTLAWANLLVPTVYVGLNTGVIGGWGVERFYLKLLAGLG